VLALWNERRVRRMIRVEELDSVRERIGTVDVAEGPAQREGGQNERNEKADEGPLHGGPDSTLRAVERTYGAVRLVPRTWRSRSRDQGAFFSS